MHARARLKPRFASASPPVLRALAFALLFGAPLAGAPALAGPEGGKVVSGTADIAQTSPKRLDITQGSDKAVIDWRSFSIAVDEHTNFRQPSASSIALNRVTGGAQSLIFGRLTANGRIFLINPDGILFGAGARVDAGGLLATTAGIKNEDFMAGRFDFDIPGNPGGTVVNRGAITVAEGGLAALVAPGVENSGTIRARLGRVALASGNAFTLDLHGDNLIRIAVDDRVAERLFAADGAELEALIANSGAIEADGGTVLLLAADAARDVVDYAINMDGIVQARTAEKRNGSIVLKGLGEGVVRVSGELDASGRGSGETGGSVKVLGEKVGLAGKARLDASGDAGGGEVLAGGNFQGKGPERNADYTTVGGDAEILADAVSAGDGGRVIVWSDRVTRFSGTISAQGGGASGDGGFAEVSGKLHLQFAPTSVDLGAAGGATGKLLLDPRDITISDSNGDNDGRLSATDTAINFSEGAQNRDFNIRPSAFEAIDADITIQAWRDITVSSPIDRSGASDSTLTLQAGRHLAINANITGTNGKHSFIFEADSPRSNRGDANGTGTLTIADNVTITSNGGSITLIGADFAISTTSGSPASINAGAGDIHIAPSRTNVVLDISTGNILTAAQIGRLTTTGTIVLGTATTGPTNTGAAGSSVSASAITVRQALSFGGSASVKFDSAGTTRLRANVTTAGGAITFSDAVFLNTAAVVSSGSGAGNIMFSSTVNGGRALTVTAGTGSVTFSGVVGGSAALASLAVTGSGGISLGANVTTTRNIDFNSAVTLTAAAVVSTGSGAGNVAFDSTVDGGYALSVTAGTGSVAFSGAVGGTTALASLAATGNGGISLAANVTTTGNIDFNSAVTLTGSGALTVTSGTGAGNIAFDGTVNGGRALTVTAGTGTVTFSGAVGGTAKLASLTVSGGQIDLNTVAATGAIAVTGTNIDLNGASYNSDDGNVRFTGPADLIVNVTIFTNADNDSTHGSITFTSTIDGAKSLSLEAGSAAVNLQGAVGGTNRLVRLTVNGGQIDLAAVAARSDISATGTNIDLNGATYESDNGNAKFTGPVDLTVNVTVDSDKNDSGADGDITFTSTINGAKTLTADADTGSVTFSGAVGGTTALTGLAATGSGGISLAANVTTTGNIDFNSAVTLTASLTVTSGTGAGNIAFDGAVNGGYALTVTAGSGSATFGGAVGGTTALARLTVSGAQIDLDAVAATGNIAITGTNIDLNGATYESADGNIAFTGPVDLHTHVSVDSDADNDSTDGSITFTSTVDSAAATSWNLTIDADGGAVNLQGAAGGTTRLASLTVDGGQIDLNTVATVSGIDIEGTNIDLNAGSYNSQGGTIIFTGSVDLNHSAAITVSSGSGGGNISFSSTINGARALTVTAGTGSAAFSGAVGGTTKLASLTITGGQVDLNTVATTGAISVTGTNIDLNAATYESDDGNIAFTGPADLHANVSVDSDKDGDTTDGSITFTSTVDGAYSLTLDAHTGAVSLQGAVGGATALTNLSITSANVTLAAVTLSGTLTLTSSGAITLKGDIAADDSAVSFSRPVVLGANVTIDTDADNDGTDGSITFTSTVNGGYALTLDADTGAVNLQGAVGGTTRLTGLTVEGGQIDLNTVATTGAISVEGANIDLNAASYTSQGGNIAFTGSVDLNHSAAVTVSSGSGAGNISFSSTIDGARALTVTAGTGSAAFSGAVGGTTKLASLTVSGGQIDLNTVATVGNIAITGTNIDLNGGTYESDDGNIKFSGPVDLHTNVTVESDADNDNTDGDITFTSTVDEGGNSFLGWLLTLDAGSGAVNLQGAVGGTSKLSNLTVDGGQIDLNSVSTILGIGIEGTNIDLNGATYETEGAAIKFTGPVDLHANVTVDSDSTDTDSGGNITFTSTVNGTYSLTLDAGNTEIGATVDLQGAVGGTTKLSSLTVTGRQIDLAAVATSGAIAVTGYNIDLNGATYNSDDGNITFTGPVDLHANASVDSDKDDDSTDGDIAFTSTVDAATAGTQSLTLDASTGDVELRGAVGGARKLNNLSITAAGIDLGAVTLGGTLTLTSTGTITLKGNISVDDNAVSFGRPVVLAANVTIDTDADNDGTDGSITFASTIDSSGVSRALTLDADTGAVNLQGAVGGTAKLATLTVKGGQIDLNSVATNQTIAITGTNIDLNGATYSTEVSPVTFTGPVDLHTNVRVDTDGENSGFAGNIVFTSTINGAYSLTADASGSTTAGSVNLQGAIGGTTKLASLTASGAQIDLAAVAVSGALSVTGTNIDLNGATYYSDDGGIAFTGPVDLHASATVDSDRDDDSTDGDIAFSSTVNGSYALTLDADTGAVNLQGAVGTARKLASLTVDGGQIDLDRVLTTGAIDVEGTNIDLNSAGYASNDGNIRFAGAVDLHSNATVNSDQNDGGADGSITFTSTINGARTLTLDADTGAVTLQGAAGGTTKLTGLTVTGGQIDLNTVAVSGAISVTGTNIDLNGATYNSDDGSITFTGPADLHASATVDSDADDDSTDGSITFSSTVNAATAGTQSLSLDADGGAVNLQGAVGATRKLASLTITGGQIDLAAVATTGAIAVTGSNIDLNGATYYSDDGDITFTGAVDLHANVSMDSDRDNDSTDGDITITSTVDSSGSARTLTLDASTGAVNLQGAAGGTTALASLTVEGGQIDLAAARTMGAISVTGTNIDLNGPTYTSADGDITFTGPVDLHASVTVNSDADTDSTDGDIAFTSTVNAATAGTQSLIVTSGTGSVTFSGAVGGTNKLASLTVSGGQVDLNTVAATGSIDVNGSNIDLNGATYSSDDGAILFFGPVDLHTSVTVDADKDNDSTDGTITFVQTVDAATAGTQALTLDADGGNVNIAGAVGDTNKLASLTATGGTVSLNAVKVAGAISVTGSTGIMLHGAYESDDGNISFTGAVTLATAAVSVDSDADDDGTDGSITFTSTIDGGFALTLDADTAAVNLQGAAGGATALASLTVKGGQIDLAAVAATGAISVTGTNIDLNGAAYESDDGDITFTGPVDLHANVSVDSDKDDDGTDGDIAFTSTIDAATAGSQSLDLDADDGGAVTLQGAVGGTTKLTSLMVNGFMIDLNTVAVSGAISVTGTNIDLNGTTYYSDDGDITFTGAVDLHASATVDSDRDNDSTDGNITFTSTVNAWSAGMQSLTLDAGSGAVNLQGSTGLTRKLASLTVDGGQVDLNSVAAAGALSVTGSNIDLNGTTYYSDDGGITFTGAVDLHASATVDSDRDNDSTDGDIAFTSTINGSYALTLDADTGAVNLQGAVGTTRKLASLTVDGGQIDLDRVLTTGAIDVEGTNIDLNSGGYASNDGNIRFAGPVDLHTNATVNSDQNDNGADGSITFTSTIDGSYALTLDADTGAVTLQGAAGGATKLTSLTVNGGQIDLNTVAVSGAISVTGTNIDLNGAAYNSDDGSITFTGAVDLHASVTVDSDADDDSTDGDINFIGTIDAATAGTQSLTLDAGTGAVDVSGAIGGANKLASLTVTGDQVDLNSVAAAGAISVTGSNIDLNGATYYSDDGGITFTGAVDLHASATVDSDRDNDSTDGDIAFTSTINGSYALTLDADTGAVNLQGAVGGATKLTSLTVDGGQIDLDRVLTTGAIDVEGTNIDLNSAGYASNDGNIRFAGPVDLHTNVTVNSDQNDDGADGSITFTSTINGSYALTLDADTGAATLQGAVGAAKKLASLTVDGGQIDLDRVLTTGAIDVEGTNIDLNSGGYASNDGNIRFAGAVDLHANVTVNSDQNDDGTDGSITFTSTINGARTLTLDADTGAVNLQGAVGGTTRLASLTVSGGQIDLNTVATTGAISVTGTNIDLNAGSYNSRGGNIAFTGPVDLHANVTVSSGSGGGNISFSTTINGGQALTVTAGTGSAAFSGAVGGTTRLASLTVSGGQIDLNTVATTGAISVTGTNIDLNAGSYNSQGGDIAFTGPVDLDHSAAVTVSSGTGAGNIAFSSTVNGARALTVTAGTGSAAFSGAVGGTTALTGLTVSGGQIDLASVSTTGAISATGSNIDLNGAAYDSDDGDIAFTGPVDLHASATVDSDADDDAANGNISFSSTIDGGHALTLDADADGGTITVSGAVGGTTPLASFTTVGGTVTLNGVTVSGNFVLTAQQLDIGGDYGSQDGDLEFNGAVRLTGAVTADTDKDNDGTAGNIRFSATIDGPYAVTLDAGTGSVTVPGAVGGATPVASLTVTGGQIDLNSVAASGAIGVTGRNIDLNGPSYTSRDGNIRFAGPADLHTGVRVDSDADNDGADGNIRFTSTLDGGHSLTLDADGGNIDFDGDVGSGERLGAVTVDKARNVTIATSMNAVSFTQRTGTGTTDFGTNTLYADTFVDVRTRDIHGRVIARDITLRAGNLIDATVRTGTLRIEAKDAEIAGRVGGVGGQGAADKTLVDNRGPGSYRLNDWTILGTGAGTRTRAELTALRLSRTLESAPRPATAADAVFSPSLPVFRASAVDATGSPYAIDVFETPFMLFMPPLGTPEKENDTDAKDRP